MMRVPDHAAVNETVNLARTRARGLVNAILRRSVREQDQLLEDWDLMSPADKYSIPDHIYSRWEKQFGIETAERIASQSNKVASLTVRSNPLRGGLTDKDKSDNEKSSFDGSFFESSSRLKYSWIKSKLKTPSFFVMLIKPSFNEIDSKFIF